MYFYRIKAFYAIIILGFQGHFAVIKCNKVINNNIEKNMKIFVLPPFGGVKVYVNEISILSWFSQAMI